MKESNIYSVDLIVENEYYNSVKEQVICPICEELKLKPMISTCTKNCQYTICGECSKKLRRCPICRKEANWINSIIINQLLSSLIFKCDICKENITFDNLKNHYHEHNNKIRINNNNSNSENEILRNNNNNHANEQSNNRCRVYNNSNNNNSNNNNSNNNSNNNNSNNNNCNWSKFHCIIIFIIINIIFY